MDAKLRSSWSAKATLAGFAPQAPVPLVAIAVLPVLPTLSSTATAEARRASEAAVPASRPEWLEVRPGSGAGEREAPVLKLGGPVRVQGPEGQNAAPVRVSDFAPAREQPEQAPDCRPGDTTALGSLPQGAAQPDRSFTETGGEPTDRPVPQPHCTIEIDPDADDAEAVAAAPARPQGSPQGDGAKPAAKGQDVATAQAPAEKPPAEPAPPTPAQAPPAEAAGQAKHAVAAAPAPITDTAKGVGAAVIDPLMPVETVTFGGDFALLFPAADPAAAPEPGPAPPEGSEVPNLPPLPLHDPDWTLIG